MEKGYLIFFGAFALISTTLLYLPHEKTRWYASIVALIAVSVVTYVCTFSEPCL